MNKTTEALKLCLEALPNILFAATERDKKNRIRMFDNCVYQAQEALDVGREALAEQDKQEPVAWTNYNGAVNNRLKNPAPVDAKAIREERDSMWLAQMVFEEKRVRAEALEEAAKVCDDYDMDHIVGQQLAAAIRSLK
jgi:hypothetical protein